MSAVNTTKVHRDLGKAQQVEHRIMGAGRTGRKVHCQRTQEVGGKGGHMAQVQQHDERAGNGRVGQPQHRSREAEQKIHRLGEWRPAMP